MTGSTVDQVAAVARQLRARTTERAQPRRRTDRSSSSRRPDEIACRLKVPDLDDPSRLPAAAGSGRGSDSRPGRRSSDTEGGQAHAQMHVAAGQLPVGTRREMVDAVHEAVSEDHSERLTATVTLGDAELVDGIRDRLDDAKLWAAGATNIITGDIKPG